MAAAKYAEATISAANSFTTTTEFRGRVNVLVKSTVTPWAGVIVLQRRYLMPDTTSSEWMTVGQITAPGLWSFVEHEQSVEYRVGTLVGLTGGSPLARLSQ